MKPGFLLALAIMTSLDGPVDMFSTFEPGWEERWQMRRMARRANTLIVEGERERHLRVESRDSATLLWRRVDLDVSNSTRLSWRWRVSSHLDRVENERSRDGDDYAARVAVMFDGAPFERETRAVMYVWAGKEPVGSIYPSPYSKNVATIVLRSGAPRRRSEWLRETRNVARDYEAFFGGMPGRLTAVGLMVDTDNTASEATAWFDELEVHAQRSSRK